MPLLNVALVPAPAQVVVRLTGESDLSTAALLADALTQAAALGTDSVVVDVAAVTFWDCSGLHALSAFTAELSAAGRSCRLVGAPAATRRLIGAAVMTDNLVLDGPLPERPAPAPRQPTEGRPADGRTEAPARRPMSGRPVPARSGRATATALAVRRRD